MGTNFTDDIRWRSESDQRERTPQAPKFLVRGRLRDWKGDRRDAGSLFQEVDGRTCKQCASNTKS